MSKIYRCFDAADILFVRVLIKTWVFYDKNFNILLSVDISALVICDGYIC